jgi:hypothetical protein
VNGRMNERKEKKKHGLGNEADGKIGREMKKLK